MATNLPYNDSVFLFRLQTLIIDGGTEVVRNIFNNRLNNQPLATFLTNEKATINRLRLKKTITKVQYDKLFPPCSQNPDSEDFDMRLLMCLLTSIQSLGLNMKYPWYTSPAQTDLSTEADLIRLRTFRNEIGHASSTHCLDEPTYNQQWNKVEQCLLRLNSGPHSDPNLQATLDSFKKSVITTMTTNSPYHDNVLYFRLQALIIDEGTEVLRNIFNNRLNNQPLITILTNEKATINRLRVKKTLTKVQYDKLFPPGGQKPDSEDFDMRLLMCLLTSIQSLGLNMKYPWYTSPAQTDLSTEADLIRLRTFRNEIANASSTHCLDERTYNQQWNKVEQCLLRLNSGPHSDPNLQATLDSLKKSFITTMTTNSPYHDSVFLFRLQALILDGGTEVVRNIFNYRLNNQPLVTFLTNEKATINRLRANKTITKVQYEKLVPPGGQKPDSEDFDITLLMVLLKNITSLGLNTSYPWHIPPAQTDMSIEADLIRLRTFRNEIANASSTHCLDKRTYKQQWNKVEQCLLRLNNGPQSDPNLQATIDSFKNSPLDPATEQRLGKQWQELENVLQSEINTKNEDISEVKGDVSNLKRGTVEGVIVEVTEDIDKAREDIYEKKGGIERIGGRVNLEEQVQNINTKLSLKKLRMEVVSTEEKLQELLIATYRFDLREMYLTPLLNKGTPLLQFYQMPDLEHVTENIELGRAAREERTPIDTWEKLFHVSNQAISRSIYICADAGLGKTAFSKYLTRAWCQSKKLLQEESEFFKPEQLEAIGKFRFVFLLILCESQKSNLCHLKDMIWEQLVSKLIGSYGIENLENILRNEKCLIILDGLDEWTYPPTCGKREQVPHWSKRENVTVITTTRPWKFNVAGLKSGQIGHRIELTGLNQKSANKLKRSCLSYFKMQQLKVECLRQQDEDEVDRSVLKFTEAVSNTHATQLESVPLMLMYMLFLYMYGFNLGDKQCDLYCRIIELLLSRTFEEKQELVTSTTEAIPHCFNKLKHVLKFYNPYLKRLGELAFKTLLEEKREDNTLVFDSSVAIKCLGKECFNQCLKTGIISQCVQIHPFFQESTVSFSHKTMQEFFAALYMYSAPDDTRMSQLVLSKCKNVQDILVVSNIIIFISGMNVNVAASISRGMMNIINKDSISHYCRNTKTLGSHINPLKKIQDMFVSCCKEMRYRSRDKLNIQDVFIDESCKDDEYRVHLQQLIQDNNNNIKSVFINMLYMEDTPYNSVQKVFEYFQLEYLNTNVEISCLSGFGRDVENISLC